MFGSTRHGDTPAGRDKSDENTGKKDLVFYRVRVFFLSFFATKSTRPIEVAGDRAKVDTIVELGKKIAGSKTEKTGFGPVS